MSTDKITYQLKIPSQTDNLELIRLFVSAVAAKVGFGPDDISKIELAVDEACANVIKHAYSKNLKQLIELAIEIDYKKISIIITDHGKGFDIKKLPHGDVKEYLAEMRVGGLGIYLMRALMDEVEFDSQPGVQTQVKMSKYLVKADQVELVQE
ncbi:MAG: ATP-binding protein [candidate division KSB1 bacterium]|nr:ATP-binding protein [candidate division KSB1 bacterium]MDZ7342743.1 ATP-binding protein [candidate division KSB1 bacterium]